MDQYLSVDNKEACRLCMRQKGNVSLLDLTDSMKIIEKLRLCVQIQVAENDGLPHTVCDKCTHKLQTSYNFKIQVEEVNTYLWGLHRESKYEVQSIIKKEELSDYDDVEYTYQTSPSPGHLLDHSKIVDIHENKEDLIIKNTPEPDTEKVVTSKRNHECLLCPELLNTLSGLRRHTRLVHGRSREKEKSYINILTQNHKEQDTSVNEDVTNEIISGEVGKPGDARLQNGETEQDAPRKKLKCFKCYKRYQFKSGLKKHTCIVKSNSHPANHDKVHRKFMCELCGRAFKHRSVLQQHMITHRGTKQFECSLCEKMFTRASHLAIHLRIHNNVKPYVCETCGRSFTKSSDLRRHCRIHSDVRNYPCTLCSKTFKRSGDVVSHMRSHTGDRPYRCNLCEKTYTSHSSLRKHQRTNAGCSASLPQSQIRKKTAESQFKSEGTAR